MALTIGELVAYLDVDTKRYDRNLDAAETRFSGFHTALKRTAIAGGVAVAAAFGTALTLGFKRLTAIEDAKASLKGLGHSAEEVALIMDNALAAVKGTAFGLGDAAMVAASTVAAGVQPGKELEKTLRLVADAATIGRTSIGEMGTIFNKVAASNKVQGEVIAQLNERGIPIVQLLGKELGVTAEQVYELSAAGTIGFSTFAAAMEHGLGGSALASGNTTTGALKNVMAAASRLGARILTGVFPVIKMLADGLIKLADYLEERFGPAFDEMGKKMLKFFKSDTVKQAFKDIGDVLKPVLAIVEVLARVGFALLGAAAWLAAKNAKVLTVVLVALGTAFVGLKIIGGINALLGTFGLSLSTLYGIMRNGMPFTASWLALKKFAAGLASTIAAAPGVIAANLAVAATYVAIGLAAAAAAYAIWEAYKAYREWQDAEKQRTDAEVARGESLGRTVGEWQREHPGQGREQMPEYMRVGIEDFVKEHGTDPEAMKGFSDMYKLYSEGTQADIDAHEKTRATEAENTAATTDNTTKLENLSAELEGGGTIGALDANTAAIDANTTALGGDKEAIHHLTTKQVAASVAASKAASAGFIGVKGNWIPYTEGKAVWGKSTIDPKYSRMGNVAGGGGGGGGGIKAFADGGDFLTNGPQLILVGEAGREHVKVTPGGKGNDEPRPIVVHLHFSGPVVGGKAGLRELSSIIQDDVMAGVRKAIGE